MILTEEMIERAIAMVTPSAKKILAEKETTWGPVWVEVVVGFSSESYTYTIGKPTPWKKKWGEFKNFSIIADAKMEAAAREKVNTSVLVASQPWNLEEGEYLYSGGATRDGIAVGVSGAKGIVDEAIAEMIISAIVMFAKLETDRRIKGGENKISFPVQWYNLD